MELFKSEGKEKVEHTDRCRNMLFRRIQMEPSQHRAEKEELWSAC